MQTAFAACKQSFAAQQKKVATISKKKVANGKKKIYRKASMRKFSQKELWVEVNKKNTTNRLQCSGYSEPPKAQRTFMHISWTNMNKWDAKYHEGVSK